MSEFSDRLAKLSPRKLALLAMGLQSRLEVMERAKTEPIAVVGMSCRFPGGANDPESFWAMLREGRDAVVDVPAEGRLKVVAMRIEEPRRLSTISMRPAPMASFPDQCKTAPSPEGAPSTRIRASGSRRVHCNQLSHFRKSFT